jgi:hypothetical protein
MLAYVRFFLYLCAQFCIIMIEYIKGQLTDINPTYVVLGAAGVGYTINVAVPPDSS